MDRFKQYLQQHAGNLGNDEPGEKVWQQLQQRLHPVKKSNRVILYTKYAIAACLIALAGIGARLLVSSYKKNIPVIATIVIPETNNPQTTNPVLSNHPAKEKQKTITAAIEKIKKEKKPSLKKALFNSPKDTSEENALPGLHNMENNFARVISLQRLKINATPLYAEGPPYYKDFKIELSQMEKDEQAIKNDIVQIGMTDELLSQLINIYQQKLSVLKKLQIEINKTNNRYRQNRKAVDSTKIYFLNL